MQSIIEPTRKLFAKLPVTDLVEKRDREIMERLETMIRPLDRVLDVGCGSGRLSKKIMKKTGARMEGADVTTYPDAEISTALFDGKNLPFQNETFDGVIILDVLHHAKNARELLDECIRVSRNYVIIKDHYYENERQLQRLRIADSIGNFAENIPTPFYFWKKSDWENWRLKRKATAEYWKSTVIPPFTVPQVMMRVQK